MSEKHTKHILKNQKQTHVSNFSLQKNPKKLPNFEWFLLLIQENAGKLESEVPSKLYFNKLKCCQKLSTKKYKHFTFVSLSEPLLDVIFSLPG